MPEDKLVRNEIRNLSGPGKLIYILHGVLYYMFLFKFNKATMPRVKPPSLSGDAWHCRAQAVASQPLHQQPWPSSTWRSGSQSKAMPTTPSFRPHTVDKYFNADTHDKQRRREAIFFVLLPPEVSYYSRTLFYWIKKQTNKGLNRSPCQEDRTRPTTLDVDPTFSTLFLFFGGGIFCARCIVLRDLETGYVAWFIAILKKPRKKNQF